MHNNDGDAMETSLTVADSHMLQKKTR